VDSALVQEQITEQFFQQLEQSKHLHYPLMNRLEGRIRNEDQLERYITVLVHTVRRRGQDQAVSSGPTGSSWPELVAAQSG
jgi:hypothetical protein